MKRQLFVVLLIGALVCSMAPASFAKSVKKDKEELKKVQQQSDDISEELDAYKKKIATSEKQLKKLDRSIKDKTKQIKKTEAELKKTKIHISDRQDGLNMRLRTMYKSGSIGYIDVILGSNSIEELVTNVDLVQKIYSNDQRILTDLKAQKVEIEKKETVFRSQKAELAKEQEKEKSTKAVLDENKNKLQSKLNTLKSTEEKLKKRIADAQAAGGVSYPGGKWAFPLKDRYTQTSHYLQQRSYEKHPGIDLAAPIGTKIYAAQSGKVTTASYYGGYGNCVMIYHGNNLTSLYGHCSRLAVSVGQTVKKGDLIAYMGSTGWSTGSHLHFEVRLNGHHISPGPYIGIQ